MNIRAKLITLVAGLFLAMAAAAGAYFAALAPIADIERERASLENLTDRIRDHLVVLNRFDSDNLSDHGEAWAASSAALADAFGAMGNLKALPNADARLAEAIGVIRKLEKLGLDGGAEVDRTFEELKLSANELFFMEAIQFRFFLTTEYSSTQAAKVAVMEERLAAFLTAVETQNDALATSLSTITEQYAVIDGEIARLRQTALVLALSIIAAIVAGAAVVAWLFVRSLSRSIRSIAAGMARVSQGDLTGRIGLASRDELGALAGNLNHFLDTLEATLADIQRVSGRSQSAKQTLLDASAQAVSTTTQISRNSRDIEDQVGRLDAASGESACAVEGLLGELGRLNGQIETQTVMVTESTAAVVEILASLENMTRITDRDRREADALLAEAAQARSVFDAAHGKIVEINGHAGSISEIAVVIDNVATQTNLLAMNAAIEAAHAGQSGHGFAIVATEIRRFSEASTQNSRIIADLIGRITALIADALEANERTISSFDAISARISQVNRSVNELFATISEIQLGARQIHEAIAELQTVAVNVQDGSRSMTESSGTIKSAMGELADSSRLVRVNVGQILDGLKEIERATGAVADTSGLIGTLGDQLDAELRHFTTTEKP